MTKPKVTRRPTPTPRDAMPAPARLPKRGRKYTPEEINRINSGGRKKARQSRQKHDPNYLKKLV